jgi:hypothetical protein
LTPSYLRGITITLNNERGTGGQSKLARMLGWHYTTLWRKLNGKSPITQSDELAINRLVDLAQAGDARFRQDIPCISGRQN